MSNEIRVDYPSANVYSCLRLPGGDVAYIAGQVLEVWGGGVGRTAADYAIALTYRGGSRHTGDIPNWLPANTYDRQAFLRDGGAPADTDTVFGSVEFTWNGSAESKPYGKGIVHVPGYVGDFKENATIRIPWDTSGITPSTPGDIRVYVDGSTTELTVPTGVTDTRAFDALSGINHCEIDLSDTNSSYVRGRDFSVVLEGMVVDAQIVNVVLATFSIRNRFQGAEFRKDV